MSFEWLKHYMPRSLYGRAALILVLPVVTLQLVVTVIFVQRHFEGVTEQLTRSVRDEIRLIVAQVETGDSRDAATAAMQPLAEALAQVCPTVLVCDIEGAEADLFDKATLSGIRLAIIEVHPQWIGETGVRAVFDAMHRNGLTYFPKASVAKVLVFKKDF